MKQSVYIETTVVSYLTARPSRDVVMAGHQEVTRAWWETRLERFRPVISEFVLREAEAGDPEAAKKRLTALKKLPLLEVTEEVEALANELTVRGPIPKKKVIDAFHIAAATVHLTDYLLTWNCTHIGNAELRSRIRMVADDRGYRLPVICTPEELMGGKGI